MNEIVILRLLHIIPGVFWAGTAVFLAVFLEPALHRLGPSIQGPVMALVGRTAGPVLTISGFLTVGAGFALTARTPGRSFSLLFENEWGWAIGMGAVASILAVLLGLLQGFSAGEVGKLMAAQQHDPPTPAQSARLAELSDRMRLIGRVDAALVSIAVALMAGARFVY